MDEIKIIELFKSWDKQVFWIIYDKYIEKVYQFIYFKTYDEQIAQDLTSITFFKALKALKKFDTKKDNTCLKSWLLKIAYNNIIDYYKKKKEEVWLDDILELWNENNYSQDIDNKEKLKEILVYISWLKKEHREILTMRIWEDLSYKEISKITWKSEDNCKKIVSRTLIKINSNISLLLLILLNNIIF